MSKLTLKIEEEANFLYFNCIAKYIKNKFNDKRTLPQLVKVIKEEYQIA